RYGRHGCVVVTCSAVPAGRVALPCIPRVPFFFKPPATPEIYTLSLHDALPISIRRDNCVTPSVGKSAWAKAFLDLRQSFLDVLRSEEHTSELQSRENLVCRLLLETKNRADRRRRRPRAARRHAPQPGGRVQGRP